MKFVYSIYIHCAVICMFPLASRWLCVYLVMKHIEIERNERETETEYWHNYRIYIYICVYIIHI